DALSRGRERTRAGAHDEAVAAFDDALAAIPRDPRALSGRGYARLLAGDLPSAEADLQAALAGGPPRSLEAAIDFNLGLVAEGRGDSVAALEYFRRSAVLRPTKAVGKKLRADAAMRKCPA